MLLVVGNALMEYEGKVHLHIRRNIAWADAVHLNIVLAPFVTDSFRKLSKRAFGRRVCRHINPALESQERAEVDNLAAPKWHHVTTSGL